MTQPTKLLLAYTIYILIAAAIVFLTPLKYHSWAIGFLVVGCFGLWRIRKAI